MLQDFGMKVLENVNREVKVQHPTVDITTVDLAELFCHTDTPGCDYRNVVIFGDRQTGISAKITTLHAKGKLDVGRPFIYESFIGSRFKSVIKEETKVGEFDAVVR